MRTFIILLALVLVGLLLTNPDMEDFKVYAESRSEELLSDKLGDSALGRAASRFGSSLAGDLVPQITERKNYGLFSMYEIGGRGESDTNGAADGDSWRFVGIAGSFFQIEGPDK